MYRFALMFVVPLTTAVAADEFDLPPTKPPSAIAQLDKNRAKIGAVLVDGEKGQISFEGKIVANSRELEAFVSAPQGRTYEGMIVCDAEPIDVATGLILLGLESGPEIGKLRPAPPEPVEVWIEWADPKTGKKISMRAEDLVIDTKKNNATLPHGAFVHVGSRWSGKRFMAQAMGDIITVEHFDDAIIDHPAAGKAGDYSYQPNPALVPPIGTPLTLIIKIVKPPAAEKSNVTPPAKVSIPNKEVKTKGLR